MATISTSELYKHHHIERGDEQRGLFELLASELACESGMYPGCLVHVTPSFYIPTMIYVDSRPEAARFFAGGYAQMTIARGKTYEAAQQIEFHSQDYTKPIAVDRGSVDLLLSQSTGIVSQACKPYLRSGGILVANNSHADAGVAGTDPDYELFAVVRARGGRRMVSDDDLTAYLTPKSPDVPDGAEERRAYLIERGRGIAYQKRASHYLFRKR